MTDRIDFGGEPWRAIPRSTLRDARLSPQAKGGLVTLLSHDEGWVRSALAILQRENDCGETRARSIMRELKLAGYVEMTYKREGGKIVGRNYVVHAVSPSTPVQGEMALEPRETPTVEEPRVVSPTVGAPYEVVEAPGQLEPQDGEPQELVLSSATAFDEWYAAYPRHEKPREARAAFEKALKRADLETLIRGALRYRSDPNREDGYTAHPATWLNGDCWLDDPLPARSSGKARSVSNLLAMADAAERRELG